jgi:hypothetical protein
MGCSFLRAFALAEMAQGRLWIEQGRTNEMQMTRHPMQPMAFLARLVHGVELRPQVFDSKRGRRQRRLEAWSGGAIEEARYLMQRLPG